MWSLCPIRIPRSASDPDASASSTQLLPSKSSVTVSKVQLPPRTVNPWPTKLPDLISNGSSTLSDHLDIRQVSASVLSLPTTSDRTTTTSAAAGNSPSQSNSSSAAKPTVSVSPVNGLIQVGQYACTTSIDLPVFSAVLAEYLSSSQNTLEAIMTYLDLNLHVAATPLNSPPQELTSTASLPASRELISNLLNVNLSSYLYTPTVLAADRANLNSSWFASPNDIQSVYFNTTKNAKGQLMTDNGWPSESLVELRHAYRLLASYGQIDPQLNRYNFSGDESVIFPQNALLNNRPILYSPFGDIEQGCFSNPSIASISGKNNSWAVSSQILLPSTPSGFDNVSIPSVSNLTSCGISPLLNETLLNTTADVNAHFYQQVAYSSIWTWAPGEPRNVSSNETNSQNMRCAAMDASQNGRWHVADCSERKYAACRVRNEPYMWKLSSTKGTHSTSVELCANDQNFSVPFTPLENSHLLSVIQARRSSSDDKDPTIWVNFNSLDIASCWVTGLNTQCPYQSNTVDVHNRAVIVPTVAGILVIVITALTMFTKCAANRQNTKSKRRRRAGDSWDYEGVPS